jgi:pimeloyl-ACP methyl ester carboxylesterase
MPVISNDGVSVNYRIIGDGEPMVLLHGLFGSTVDWVDSGHVELYKDKLKLILIDVRGHGYSGKPHDARQYKMKYHVSDVLCVLDDLGLEKTHFHGFSMGGWIGFGIIKYAPDRLMSAILGGAQPYDDWVLKWKPAMNRMLKENGAAFLKRAATFFDPYSSPVYAENCLQNDVEAIIALTDITETLNLEDALPGTSVPCLLWGGEEDNMSWIGAKERIQVIPNGRYVSLEGGGNHFKSFYQANLLKPYIDQFINEIQPKP